MAARKFSMSALATRLTKDGVPFRIIQSKDGETTIEVLTAPTPPKPIADIKAEIARRISEIPAREIRSRGQR